MVQTATAASVSHGVWYQALEARVVAQASVAPVAPIATAARAMVATTTVSSFYPVWGVAIEPLRSLSPDRVFITLPFDEQSLDMCRAEFEASFFSIFAET